ncbi:MAG: PAS domain S-box protein [Fimbriimonadaceae bacterium]|jgi:PAS domain S-box-containing protein|nr:PAS domain S-box protein [Fimbriimonadaceae bacterium]
MQQIDEGSSRILSPREEQIVDLSCQGLTDKEIAARLSISTGTLNTYWNRVRRKLKGSSRAELASSLVRIKAEGRLKELEAEAELLKQNLNKLSRTKNVIQTELHEVGLNLAKAEAQHKATLELLDVGVVSIGANGVLQEFSQGAEKIFGYKAEEVIGRSVEVLMPDAQGRRHQIYVDRHVATGTARILGMGRTVTALRSDGEEIEVFIEVRKVLAAGEWSFVAIIRPA